MNDVDRIEPRTEQETALIAVHAGRAAELSQQMTLILLRSLTREAEQQQA
jgi:hypothetical protein